MKIIVAMLQLAFTVITVNATTDVPNFELSPDLSSHLGQFALVPLDEVRHAISGDFDCETSDLDVFIEESFDSLVQQEQEVLDFLLDVYRVDLWPVLALIFFEVSPDGNQNFYPDKQQSKKLVKDFRGLKKFWDFVAVSVLEDVKRTFEAYPNVAQHPLLSLNAFAWNRDSGLPGVTGDGIAIGDGILQYYEWAGLGSGPSYALFHEFGHHIEFSLGIFPGDRTPESSRHSELLADYLAAYYAIHARGATFRQDRVEETVTAAFNGGDCSFTSSNHHGTPNQRAKTVQFAASLIDSAPNQGHILSAEEVVTAFEHDVGEILPPRN
ncbi:expressed unknown protein [Seminavis robusta]|uniref:Uncharacterized protein n=1 Tax=Seminavis robusta TaxID=568900 RepID=A0A9N8E009_9STRA|nr:expressed unknown protein [Seminavis robusta]|eukprot:Sro489_g153380.1 n/a (325) ;mRNA; f:54178-55501